jgi:hypothetical protein
MAKDKVYTQDMGQPPKEPDDASVGRKYVPEQLGSGIRVEPVNKPKGGLSVDSLTGKGKQPPIPTIPLDKPGSLKDVKMRELSKGGTASARGDGIAQRGKTRGTMVMCGGGMTKK